MVILKKASSAAAANPAAPSVKNEIKTMKAEEREAREESRVLKGLRRRQQEKGEVERGGSNHGRNG